MKKVPPLHPICFAAFPILALYGANANSLPINEMYRPLAFSVGAATALTLVLTALLRNSHRAAIMVSFLTLYVFGFIHFVHLAPTDYLFHQTGVSSDVLWAGLVVILAALAIWKIKPEGTKAFNFIGLVLVGLAGYNSYRLANRVRDLHPLLPNAFQGKLNQQVPEDAPDLYIVVLDGHGRADALKENLGYDSTWFTKELEKRGFWVGDKSRSNYCQTELSIPSFLNGAFITDLFPQHVGQNPPYSDRAPLQSSIDENALAAFLSKSGYLYMGIDSGFWGVDFKHAQYRFELGAPGFSALETTLINGIPYAGVRAVQNTLARRGSDLVSAIKNVGYAAEIVGNKRFVVAHILAPHPSFSLNKDGSLNKEKWAGCGFEDGEQYMACEGATPETYAKGYAGQAEFIERALLASLDKIIKSNRRAVIWILGDHGSKKNFHSESLQKTKTSEVFANLCAVYATTNTLSEVKKVQTPINIMRVILNQEFGQNLPLEQDKSFYSAFSTPFEFTEIPEKDINR